jgi:chitin disaccharide deacetylase
MLIINADDYGLNTKTTDNILSCFTRKRIHSTSAMTFMSDSERAADLARENQMPVGLHLNLDELFTGPAIPSTLIEHHNKMTIYLKGRKWNQILYNPFLRNTFDYVFQAQWDEFTRLYHKEPKRLDGHHHLHLCMNMLLSGKIPNGITIRRNFTFYRGEKNPINRLYRRLVDWWLESNFSCADSFFSMKPIDLSTLQRLVVLSETSDVEIMVHPGMENEYLFLLSSEWGKLIFQETRV